VNVTNEKCIDINCDMGESFGAWQMGDDAAIMPLVSSANIACGFHGGDPATIRKTVKLAMDAGAAIGAHPSLPDLMGFGRRSMRISAQDMYDYVVYQAGAVGAFVRAAGGRLHHVKCHGALYNMAATDAGLAGAMAEAVKALGPDVMLYALAGSRMVEAANLAGVPVVEEAFADRSYQPDGTLTPRGTAGAMIEDEARAVQQALGMVAHGTVATVGGGSFRLRPGTICLHGDQPGALRFANALRAALHQHGNSIKAP